MYLTQLATLHWGGGKGQNKVAYPLDMPPSVGPGVDRGQRVGSKTHFPDHMALGQHHPNTAAGEAESKNK